MRFVVGIVLLLMGIGLLSSRLQFSLTPPAQAEAAPWVRTIDGWERADGWAPSISTPPRLHPLVVASGQAFFSLLALAIFAADSGRRPGDR